MKLQTQIPLKKAGRQIDYDSRLFLLGSCFSAHIGDKFKFFKFRTLQNPFGILFHPLAIKNLISRAIDQKTYTEDEVFFLNERWHCFDAHSDLSDGSKEKLIHNLNEGLAITLKSLQKSSHIIITLGTAWGYKKSKTEIVVANCHKVPQNVFEKELLSIDTIVKSLRCIVTQIQSVNREAQIIFTISPVRHLKDGFVENQRSKAHLISAVHEIIDTSNFEPRISYFMSYELMMDELRDYRFYEANMVHPNPLAIDYIWERFMGVWISENAFLTMDEVADIQKGLHHIPFDAKSGQYQNFLKSMQKKIVYLQQKYPYMEFRK